MNSHDISTESLKGELLLPSSLYPAERVALAEFDAVRDSLGSEVVDVQLFGSKARGMLCQSQMWMCWSWCDGMSQS
jgi:hypothetical protein